jgi:hypothetical protein
MADAQVDFGAPLRIRAFDGTKQEQALCLTPVSCLMGNTR